MAELVGTHCAHPPCNALDFLPLSCPLCRRPFCALHSTPPTHLCSQLDAAPVQGHTFADKFNDLLPDRDRRTTERADATEEREAKKLKGRALLSKNFGRTPAVPTRTTGKGSKSAVIELMKLKGRATPGDVRKGPAAVSMLDRIYLIAVLLSREGEDLRETARKELWFASNTTVGRTVDLLATQFGLSNTNDSSTNPAHMLSAVKLVIPNAPSLNLHPATKPAYDILTNSVTLQGSLQNGETIYLLRGGL